MIHYKMPTFITWVQQKVEPEDLEANVLTFYQGYYSKEQERNKKSEEAKGEQI